MDFNSFSTLASLLPHSVLLSLISTIHYISVLISPYIEQSKSTYQAIKDSFQPKGIYVFYSGKLVPFGYEILPNMTPQQPDWYYFREQRIFSKEFITSSTRAQKRKMPWLGAELKTAKSEIISGNKSVADLTTWLDTIWILSDDLTIIPPANVLVSTWAQEHEKVIISDKMTLVIIDEMGEEVEINFQSSF